MLALLEKLVWLQMLEKALGSKRVHAFVLISVTHTAYHRLRDQMSPWCTTLPVKVVRSPQSTSWLAMLVRRFGVMPKLMTKAS